jgi:hypothetical protein
MRGMTHFYFQEDDPTSRIVRGMGNLQASDGPRLIERLQEVVEETSLPVVFVDLTTRPNHGTETPGVAKAGPNALQALREAGQQNREQGGGTLKIMASSAVIAELKRQGGENETLLELIESD